MQAVRLKGKRVLLAEGGRGVGILAGILNRERGGGESRRRWGRRGDWELRRSSARRGEEV